MANYILIELITMAVNVVLNSFHQAQAWVRNVFFKQYPETIGVEFIELETWIRQVVTADNMGYDIPVGMVETWGSYYLGLIIDASVEEPVADLDPEAPDMRWWFNNLDVLVEEIENPTMDGADRATEAFKLFRHLLYMVAMLPTHETTARMITRVEQDWEVFFDCMKEIMLLVLLARTRARRTDDCEKRIIATLGWLIQEMIPIVGYGGGANEIKKLLATASS